MKGSYHPDPQVKALDGTSYLVAGDAGVDDRGLDGSHQELLLLWHLLDHLLRGLGRHAVGARVAIVTGRGLGLGGTHSTLN